MPDQPDDHDQTGWTQLADAVRAFDAKAVEYRRAQRQSRLRRDQARLLTGRRA